MAISKRATGLQRRAVRASEWTKTKRAIFLDVLATSCNINRAAKAAGIRVWW